MVAPRHDIDELPVYSPGRPIEVVQAETGLQDLIKLASNESLWGPSPAAVKAAQKALGEMHMYPLVDLVALKDALIRAQYPALTREQLVIGNGGDEILRLAAQAFLTPDDSAVYPTPSFGAYRFIIALAGATGIPIPLLPSGAMDLEAMLEAIRPNTRILILCNPNNPTGSIFSAQDWAHFLERVPDQVLVVMDEAYHEFADAPDYPDTLASVVAGRPVLHVRTFSKVHALAGLRLGWGAAPAGIVRHLLRVQDPFAVNRVVAAAGLASLDDAPYIQRVLEETRVMRRFLTEALAARRIPYYPSQANFVTLDTGSAADDVAKALEYQGVIVRSARSFGMPQHIRVTVAPQPYLERFLEALDRVLPGKA